ncbi:MAG: ABC transporter permease [Rubripirellula sp.]
MRFTTFTLKNLTRRPFRSALTLLALATAIASVVALLGITKGFVKAFEDVYASHSVDIVVSRQGSADRLSSSVDETFAKRIADQEGVARTAGVLLDSLSLEEQEMYGVPSMGVAADSWMLKDYRLRSEASPDRDDPRQVMLGVHVADRIGVKAGDSVMLFEEPYRVTGVFESRSTWENGSMILPLTQLQQLTDRQGQVTYINVVLESGVVGDRAAGVLQAIEDVDPKLLAMTTDEFVSTDTRMQVASAMAWMTSIIALVIGAIGTLNTMMTSVMERTVEIGILRAIGWPRRRVAKMILMESLGLALVACILGATLAVVGTTLLSQADAAKGILAPSIDSVVLMQGFAVALFIGLVGALLPAWRAASLMPNDALQER